MKLRNWRRYIAIPFLWIVQVIRWLWDVAQRKYSPFFIIFFVSIGLTVWLYGSPFNSYATYVLPAAVTSDNPTFQGDLAIALQLPLHISQNVFHIGVKICPADTTDRILSTTTNVAGVKIDGAIQPYINISGRNCPLEVSKINHSAPDLFCFKEGEYSEFTYPADLGFSVGSGGPFTDCMPPANDPTQGLLQIWITPSWASYSINFLAVYIVLAVIYSVYITIRDRKR